MYGYIKGIVTEIESSYIILENNNVGYLIYVANPYSFQVDNEYKVYTYTQIKEDEHLLYGFKEKEEKELFLKLISVKGLGCKMALPILATSSIRGIADAIDRENILYLKKFPKIGDKVARQIILDLKGKLTVSGNVSVNNNELVDVLLSLGYKNPEIKKVIPNVKQDLSLEDQVKEALKLLLK